MDVYALIKTHVVDHMTPVITLTSIETIVGPPVRYKLFTCNTQWVTVRHKITIDGVIYTVTDFVIDEYIIVSGASAPVQLYFQLTAPIFEHGTHRRVNNERSQKSANKRTITPMIYMLPVKSKRPAFDSMFGFVGPIRMFFLTTFDAKGDSTVDTQQNNVINPMSKMVEYFFQQMEDRIDIFEDTSEAEVDQDDHMDFGDPAVWGNKNKIFDENLSGVGISWDSKIYRQDNCCEDVPAVSCLPVKLKIEGVLVETLPSGETFDLNLIDTDGNVPAHSYDAPTNTLEVAASGGGGVASQTFNGAPLVDQDGGTTKVITNKNSAGDDVGTVGTDTALLTEIVTGDSNKSHNGVTIVPTPATQDIEFSTYDSLGNFVGTLATNTANATDVIIGNSNVAVKKTGGALIANVPVLAEGNTDYEVPDSEVLITDSALTLLHTVPVKANSSTGKIITDGSIILQDIHGNVLTTYANKAQEAKVVQLPIIYMHPANSGYGTTSFLTGDEGWNEVNRPRPAVPLIGIPALLDPSNPKKLLYKNIYNHLHRFVGINGGYYDYDTLTYHLADGTLSDQATVFGTTAANTSYMWDTHTQLGRKWNVQGSTTWGAQITAIHGLTHAGFSDYFLGSRKQQDAWMVGFNIALGLTAIVPINSNNTCKTSTPTFGNETTQHHQMNASATNSTRSDATNDSAYAFRWHAL